jgi:hypothetical protein
MLSIPHSTLAAAVAIIGLLMYAKRCWRRGGHWGHGLFLDLIAIACLIAVLIIIDGPLPW